MISFPIFERLTVRDYGLYPGRSSRPGLDLQLQPGLTLVLGANGLGKTTLVTMLYRMCTGPFDIPGLSVGGELGTRNLEARRLPRAEARLFASRVVDSAEHATATLEMTLGSARLVITRSLSSLAPTELSVDGEALSPTDETYQQAILAQSGVSSFGDWILLLQHLTFYFETRRALVWDASAQRQILRILLLPATTGSEWRRLERAIVENDSRMRNLQAALTREERTLEATAALASDGDAVRDELRLLEKRQEVDTPTLAALDQRIVDEDSTRQSARLAALKAEAAHESAYRDLERQQLLVIASAFPTSDDTARYLLGKLFSESYCLACGQVAVAAVDTMRKRQSDNRCVVCDTPLRDPAGTKSLTTRSLSRATIALQRAGERLEAANNERRDAEAAFDALISELQKLNTETANRAVRIDELLRRLPPDDVELHQRQDELASLRRRVELMKADLADERAGFTRFIAGVNRTIARRRTVIQETFARFAEGFLLEQCELAWAPHKARLGETGGQIAFPSFELELGGTDFPSPVRRQGPQQVSESQREFIDLAFRMTLMSAAGVAAEGTLVIDAPESSLDAVFVTRAADVLTRFAAPEFDNRLIVTSNLIEGDLIPELVRRARISSASDARVVDLLKLAAPTAATHKLHKEYAAVRRRLFARAKQLDS